MSEFMSYDPWVHVTTRNGFGGDEIISMLQKSIRRGNEEDALMAAYEMYITSPQFEEKLWRKLMVISVEDIGFGEPLAGTLVYSMNQIRKEFLYDEGDRSILFVHAIRYLCKCSKERSNDHIKTLLVQDFAKDCPLKIPEYALDMHTRKGRELGRDIAHFYREASKVIPQLEMENYHQLYEKVLNRALHPDESESKNKVESFEYIPFQS